MIQTRLSLTFFVFLAVAPARAEELWVAPTHQQDVGGLGIASNAIWPVTPLGAVRFAWGVPDDLQAFESAKLVLIPHSPGGAADLISFVCAAESGDPALAQCTGPLTHTFTGIAGQLLEIDISDAILPQVGISGETHLAVLAYTIPTTATDHIVGLRFAYQPNAPSDVATLGANTFSGAQTAPAFVGDGSGLTNLPAPSGVAMLGANTFTGAQTAPAFVGDGSGLTNLPTPLGVATLGANSFTGTQTVEAGNFDLDPSTATTGILTKNGTRFLHDFGSGNTFLGENSGNLTTTGVANTGTGVAALQSNTDGGFNTAHGHVALRQNTGGNQNTAIGAQALGRNTGGSFNTASGNTSLLNNTTGTQNTATGVSALHTNTTGSGNTALGVSALFNNSGDNNVAIGLSAGFGATAGSNNIYLGTNVSGVAGESNTMYLGRVGAQTKTVIAGVRDTDVVGGEMVLVDPDGRLGSGPVVTGANTVGTGEVIDDSLRANDLAANSVGSSELADNSVGVSEVAFAYAGSASEGGPATGLDCAGCIGTNHVQDRSLTGQDLQSGSVGSFEIAPAAITASELANNSVTGLHIVGNTIQHFDIADEAGVEFAGGAQQMGLGPAPVPVRSIEVSAPSNGQIIVFASGTFMIDGSSDAQPVCSITTGLNVDSDAVFAAGLSNFVGGFVPFAGTRGFAVSEGIVTVRLICLNQVGLAWVLDSQMTALFAPTRY